MLRFIKLIFCPFMEHLHISRMFDKAFPTTMKKTFPAELAEEQIKLLYACFLYGISTEKEIHEIMIKYNERNT